MPGGISARDLDGRGAGVIRVRRRRGEPARGAGAAEQTGGEDRSDAVDSRSLVPCSSSSAVIFAALAASCSSKRRTSAMSSLANSTRIRSGPVRGRSPRSARVALRGRSSVRSTGSALNVTTAAFPAPGRRAPKVFLSTILGELVLNFFLWRAAAARLCLHGFNGVSQQADPNIVQRVPVDLALTGDADASCSSLGQSWSMKTREYAPGRLVDLFGDPAERTVLLWHGTQADARSVVRPLAELVASHGLGVVVPDWNSHADDGGRADLLRSVHFARKRAGDSEDLVVVGWSLGGVAAAGLTIHSRFFGVRLAHTLCLAGAFMAKDPISGEDLETELLEGGDRSSFTLLHGIADDVVPVKASRAFAATLERSKWPVEVVELAADHGSIGGATYDPAAGRYSAAEDPETLAVAADVAARIATAIGRR